MPTIGPVGPGGAAGANRIGEMETVREAAEQEINAIQYRLLSGQELPGDKQRLAQLNKTMALTKTFEERAIDKDKQDIGLIAKQNSYLQG